MSLLSITYREPGDMPVGCGQKDNRMWAAGARALGPGKGSHGQSDSGELDKKGKVLDKKGDVLSRMIQSRTWPSGGVVTYGRPLQDNYLLIEDWWAGQGHQGAGWPAMNW